MRQNVGDEDRSLRLGLVLVALALIGLWSGPMAWPQTAASPFPDALLVGAVYLFATAAWRKCPTNALLDRDTVELG